MRILWISHSPEMPTGYGNVTRFVCSKLARKGYEIDILGSHTVKYMEFESCRIYPGYGGGLDTKILGLLEERRPDILLILANIWWLPYIATSSVRRQLRLSGTPSVFYFPVDGNTQTGQVPLDWVRTLNTVDFRIAMSRYGQTIAKRCGLRCDYIPHGVELNVFSPPVDRDSAKHRVGYDGRFVILSDSRNQPRKLLPRLLDVFASFARNRPDALLHIHTNPKDEFLQSGSYSYDLLRDIDYYGLRSQVQLTPAPSRPSRGGLPLSELAAYYQAADVHLLTSGGEGFGLPTLQAAAAGAVPMACAYSASEELTRECGDALPVSDWVETEVGILRALIDIKETVRHLVDYYENRSKLLVQSERARRFAESYSWEAVVSEWDHWLSTVVGGRYQTERTRQRSRLAASIENRATGISGATSVESPLQEYKRSELRIPTTRQDFRIGAVRVTRRMGYTMLDESEVPIFSQLRQIFPILKGWIILQPRDAALVPPAGTRFCAAEDPEDVRYRLAQSVLMLNVNCRIPESTLVDAALFGVACIGGAQSNAQSVLWPELTTNDHGRAVALGRELLTNAALFNRLVDKAHRVCGELYRASEEEAASGLMKVQARIVGNSVVSQINTSA